MEDTLKTLPFKKYWDAPPIAVALYFKASDAPKLWDLASRHWPDEDELSAFAKAARATERGLPIVIEFKFKYELEHIAAFFTNQGIEPPRMEQLRLAVE